MADTPYRSGAGLRALLGRMHYEHTDILESFGRDVFVMDGDSLLGYLLEAEDFPRPRVSGMPLDAARDDSALDMDSGDESGCDAVERDVLGEEFDLRQRKMKDFAAAAAEEAKQVDATALEVERAVEETRDGAIADGGAGGEAAEAAGGSSAAFPQLSFQVLPIIYRAEHVLGQLQLRGAQFRVFFQQVNDDGWVGSSALVREALITHLVHNTDIDVDLVNVSAADIQAADESAEAAADEGDAEASYIGGVVHPWHKSWQQYLGMHLPSFVMIKTEWAASSQRCARKSTRRLAAALALHCLADQLPVVSFSGDAVGGRIDFCRSEFKAFFLAPIGDAGVARVARVDSPFMQAVREQECVPAMQRTVALDATGAPIDLRSGEWALDMLGSAVDGSGTEWSCPEEFRSAGWRLPIAAAACAALVRDAAAGAEGALPLALAQEWSKVFLLHIAALDAVPLADRAVSQKVLPVGALDAAVEEPVVADAAAGVDVAPALKDFVDRVSAHCRDALHGLQRCRNRAIETAEAAAQDETERAAAVAAATQAKADPKIATTGYRAAPDLEQATAMAAVAAEAAAFYAGEAERLAGAGTAAEVAAAVAAAEAAAASAQLHAGKATREADAAEAARLEEAESKAGARKGRGGAGGAAGPARADVAAVGSVAAAQASVEAATATASRAAGDAPAAASVSWVASKEAADAAAAAAALATTALTAVEGDASLANVARLAAATDAALALADKATAGVAAARVAAGTGFALNVANSVDIRFMRLVHVLGAAAVAASGSVSSLFGDAGAAVAVEFAWSKARAMAGVPNDEAGAAWELAKFGSAAAAAGCRDTLMERARAVAEATDSDEPVLYAVRSPFATEVVKDDETAIARFERDATTEVEPPPHAFKYTTSGVVRNSESRTVGERARIDSVGPFVRARDPFSHEAAEEASSSAKLKVKRADKHMHRKAAAQQRRAESLLGKQVVRTTIVEGRSDHPWLSHPDFTGGEAAEAASASGAAARGGKGRGDAASGGTGGKSGKGGKGGRGKGGKGGKTVVTTAERIRGEQDIKRAYDEVDRKTMQLAALIGQAAAASKKQDFRSAADSLGEFVRINEDTVPAPESLGAEGVRAQMEIMLNAFNLTLRHAGARLTLFNNWWAAERIKSPKRELRRAGPLYAVATDAAPLVLKAVALGRRAIELAGAGAVEADEKKDKKAKKDKKEKKSKKDKKEKKEKKEKKAPTAASLMDELAPLAGQIVQTFREVGFPEMADSFLSTVESAELVVADAKPLRKERPVRKALDASVLVNRRGQSAVLFQLLNMGPDMPRPKGKPDPRVTFPPDAWQAKLLNVVDSRESALVVAPTSAGKTFASFFAMQRVLEMDSDGIVMYVAPTKQLVNQAFVETWARFSKTYDVATATNTSLTGSFVREYRQNMQSCQVLVTVPECAESVFLSASSAERSRKISYVILDEVHNIVSSNGAVWEHVLTFNHAPFLALSATVGNPGDFHDWLSRISLSCGRPCRLVAHGERWNDLQLFLWPGTSSTHKRALLKDVEVSQLQTGRDDDDEVDDGPEEDAAGGAGAAAAATAAPGPAKAASPPKAPAAAVAARAGDDSSSSEEESSSGSSSEEDSSSDEGEEETKGAEAVAEAVMPLHAAGLVNPRVLNVEGGGPERGIELVPEDAPALHSALYKVVSEHGATKQQVAIFLPAIRRLEPNFYFSEEGEGGRIDDVENPEASRAKRDIVAGFRITLRQAHHYASKLADMLRAVAKAHPPTGAEVVRLLSRPTKPGFDRLAASMKNMHTMEYLRRELLPALRALEADDKLPVLVFQLDPVRCEQLAYGLSELLAEEEAEARKGTKWEKAILEADTLRPKLRTELEKLKADKASDDPGSDVSERIASIKAQLARLPSREDVDTKFAFVPPNGGPSMDDMRDALHYDRLQITEVMASARNRALLRGIGAHHEGMGRSYREAVEFLFRKGKLRVVVATSTLAQGIHMPCRSVVMAGDSQHLHALTYRQMSGRAGRRGFDTRGNVVFLGVPRPKMERLVTCSLPGLRGNAPVSASMVLRLALRFAYGVTEDVEEVEANYAGTTGAAIAHSSAQARERARREAEADRQAVLAGARRLLHLPFLVVQQPAAAEQQALHFRFSMEYLVRTGMLASDGAAMDPAGLVAHLCYTESAVFALAALLRSGVLESIVQRHSEDQVADKSKLTKQVKDRITRERDLALLSIFCVLFERMPLHPRHAAAVRSGRFRTSKVVLQSHEMGADAIRELQRHNRQAVELFARYLRAYTLTHTGDAAGAESEGSRNARSLLAQHSVLPLSKLDCSAPRAGEGGALSGAAVPFTVRSPFAALRGVGDDFASMEELAHTARAGLFVDTSQVPVFNESGTPLNRFVLDFYTHGVVRALQSDNQLAETTAWMGLKQFSLVLKSVASALRRGLGTGGHALSGIKASGAGRSGGGGDSGDEAAAVWGEDSTNLNVVTAVGGLARRFKAAFKLYKK